LYEHAIIYDMSARYSTIKKINMLITAVMATTFQPQKEALLTTLDVSEAIASATGVEYMTAAIAAAPEALPRRDVNLA
jgi:hypothetical protein